MAKKNYLPTLFKVLLASCSFITRYRTQILKAIGAEHSAALDNVVLACNVLQDIIAPLIASRPDDPHV